MYVEAYRETLIISDVFVTAVYVLVPGMASGGYISEPRRGEVNIKRYPPTLRWIVVLVNTKTVR